MVYKDYYIVNDTKREYVIYASSFSYPFIPSWKGDRKRKINNQDNTDEIIKIITEYKQIEAKEHDRRIEEQRRKHLEKLREGGKDRK